MPKGKNGIIEVYLESNKADVGWIRLPAKKEVLSRELEKMTGSKTGRDYTISSYVCPYFEVFEYENIELLNTVADIIENLSQEEKLLLKGWCNVHEQGVPDLTEIGNAAVQIGQGKVSYRKGIVETKDLGMCIAEESGLSDAVRKITEKDIGIGANYIDYVAGQMGYYYTDFKGQLVGYIMDDKSVNEFLYTQEELLNYEWKGKKVGKNNGMTPSQECMKRTAGRTVPRERGDRGYER